MPGRHIGHLARQRRQPPRGTPRIGRFAASERTRALDRSQRHILWHLVMGFGQSVTQRVKAILHAPDTLEQFRIDAGL